MMRGASKLDLLIVSPGDHKIIYQDLAAEYAALEPPIWAGLIANFARHKGCSVDIIDQQAEGLTPGDIVRRALDDRPRLVAILVYGQQPSASTQNMTMAGEIAAQFSEHAPEFKTILIGGHVSAIPEPTMRETACDFVCEGEGPCTVDALLQLENMNDPSDYSKVPGLWYRRDGHILNTNPAPVVPEKELPATLPGIAWDLLPMHAYRAHNWHCFSHIHDRSPYASMYTSLGCPFRCTFCCINAPFGSAGLRCWDPKFVITELDLLANRYRVKNIKIADEMFVLNERHVLDLCDLIIERGYEFNFWAYARVDTVKDRFLEKLKKAGFNWLCLGIESRSNHVRAGVVKGQYSEEDIYDTVQRIKNAGIHAFGNYIFGLPDDTCESMQETLDLAVDLNCEMANFYCAAAYPGSKLYEMAKAKGWRLPEKWHDFSQHSYGQLPLPTETLPAGEVLAFRDKAWQIYFTNPRYLNLILEKFGREAVDHIAKLTTYTLRRKHAAPLRVEPCLRKDATEVKGVSV